MIHRIRVIVSGGQTGVDRAALDFALERGIAYGGWCPAGGWAEDEPEPPGVLARYPQLTPTDSADPAERTRLNVRDSHATLVIASDSLELSPGTALTVTTARELGRPHLPVTIFEREAAGRVKEWLRQLETAKVLNVAGPRESSAPGIYAQTLALLAEIAS